MKISRWLCLFVVLSVSMVAFAGDIQVSCEPGLRVFLDDEPMGTSSAREDGLFLMNVMAGSHTIRIEKDGFLPQTFDVDTTMPSIEIFVEEFEPLPVAPAAMEAAPAKPKTTTKGVGGLVITSAPQYCFVAVDGKVQEKTSPSMTVGGLAAGEHTISFTKEGWEPISAVVDVSPGADVTVRGNFKEGKVEVIHKGLGALRVISKPMKCTVHVLGMRKDKIYQNLNLGQVPAGVHWMVVSIPGRQLPIEVLIMDRHRTIVEVSFMKGDEPFVVTHVPL